MRSILRTLNRRKEPEGGIRHGENLTKEETNEYLGLLLRNNLIALEESGLYRITPSGSALLKKWGEIDMVIANSQLEGRSLKRRLTQPVEAAGRT